MGSGSSRFSNNDPDSALAFLASRTWGGTMTGAITVWSSRLETLTLKHEIEQRDRDAPGPPKPLRYSRGLEREWWIVGFI